MLTCVEICAGAGGQALGLHMAGFEHVALVEYEPEYCDVLKQNMPDWNVICGDVHAFDAEMSEIIGICIDACKRGEIDDTERMLMERLGRQ